MSTAPKTAKAGRKQRIPVQATNGAPTNTSAKASTLLPFWEAPTLPSFWEALFVAQKLLMGYSDGDLVGIGELEREARACECSTREAIREAQLTEKLWAFHSGFEEWQKKLCASGTKYYKTCFRFSLDNRTELDVNLSSIAAKLGRTAKIESPAEFARDFVAGDLSAFLRVTALEGEQKAREIDSNGRVREFVRHACGDLSGRYTELNTEKGLRQVRDMRGALIKMRRGIPALQGGTR